MGDLRKEEIRRQAQTQEECHVKMKAESEVMLLQTKKCQIFPADY